MFPKSVLAMTLNVCKHLTLEGMKWIINTNDVVHTKKAVTISAISLVDADLLIQDQNNFLGSRL